MQQSRFTTGNEAFDEVFLQKTREIDEYLSDREILPHQPENLELQYKSEGEVRKIQINRRKLFFLTLTHILFSQHEDCGKEYSNYMNRHGEVPISEKCHQKLSEINTQEIVTDTIEMLEKILETILSHSEGEDIPANLSDLIALLVTKSQSNIFSKYPECDRDHDLAGSLIEKPLDILLHLRSQ